MILNRFLLGKVSQVSFSRNTYVYFKYNFFNVSRLPVSYSFLTRFMLSHFVLDLSKSELGTNSKGVGSILSNVKIKFPTLFSLNTSLYYANSSVYDTFMLLIQG